MKARELELFRCDLLIHLNSRPGFAFTSAMIKVNAQASGFEVTEAQITGEMIYLQDKGLVRESAKLISPENKRWEITSAGRDYLAQQGLAS